MLVTRLKHRFQGRWLVQVSQLRAVRVRSERIAKNHLRLGDRPVLMSRKHRRDAMRPMRHGLFQLPPLRGVQLRRARHCCACTWRLPGFHSGKPAFSSIFHRDLRQISLVLLLSRCTSKYCFDCGCFVSPGRFKVFRKLHV